MDTKFFKANLMPILRPEAAAMVIHDQCLAAADLGDLSLQVTQELHIICEWHGKVLVSTKTKTNLRYSVVTASEMRAFMRAQHHSSSSAAEYPFT